jgi:hypothetical protein
MCYLYKAPEVLHIKRKRAIIFAEKKMNRFSVVKREVTKDDSIYKTEEGRKYFPLIASNNNYIFSRYSDSWLG